MASKTSVLIVEDEAITAKDIQGTLATRGFNVVGITASGEEAIESARKLKPQIILMDIKLKGAMDGLTAATTIKEELGIPIIFVTAFVDFVTRYRAKNSGPNVYLIKPFADEDLFTAIKVSFHYQEINSMIDESERRYRSVLEQNPNLIVMADISSHGITDASATFSTRVGLPVNSMVGEPVWKLFDNIQPPEKDELQAKEWVSVKRTRMITVNGWIDVEIVTSVVEYAGERSLCITVKPLADGR